ncbi:hypothetical protein O3P69_004619 [Scylla paramamosain]|uniref:Uncharacterized protein n=1 Tax=Scylla paramamosain TaxID=85552 RepID=A0AAW0UD03_SCYPA
MVPSDRRRGRDEGRPCLEAVETGRTGREEEGTDGDPVSLVAGSRGRREGQLVRSPWRRLPLCPRCVGIFMVQLEGRDTARCSGRVPATPCVADTPTRRRYSFPPAAELLTRFASRDGDEGKCGRWAAVGKVSPPMNTRDPEHGKHHPTRTGVCVCPRRLGMPRCTARSALGVWNTQELSCIRKSSQGDVRFLQ